ncbi:MAG: hypothetical protein HOQ09_14690 [Gemmatimonadaceae bacterium]|nr:hypothetical protein [Gemmatimonadaceae bacterium]
MRQPGGVRLMASVMLVAGVGACATLHRPDASRPFHDPNLITHEDIVRSGATNAYDALRRGGTFLSMSEVRGGRAVTHDFEATSRGRSSLVMNPQVLLVVDDVMRLDLASLREIPAENVAWIRVMTAMEATPYYGTEGGNGAIVVRTRVPDSGN